MIVDQCSVNYLFKMSRSLRSNTQINLIGFEQFQILITKLPTIEEVLQVCFYNLRTLKMKIRECATLAVREAILFCNQAGIPIKQEYHCIEKLEKIYNEWRGVCKQCQCKRRSDATIELKRRQKENEDIMKIKRWRNKVPAQTFHFGGHHINSFHFFN